MIEPTRENIVLQFWEGSKHLETLTTLVIFPLLYWHKNLYKIKLIPVGTVGSPQQLWACCQIQVQEKQASADQTQMSAATGSDSCTRGSKGSASVANIV